MGTDIHAYVEAQDDGGVWRVVTNDRYAAKTRDEAAESFMSNVIDLARTHEHKFLFIKLADDLGVDIASAL